jgi:hypothetical protein
MRGHYDDIPVEDEKPRRRIDWRSILLVIGLFAMVGGFVWCGYVIIRDDVRHDREWREYREWAAQEISDCIDSGGEPNFTANRYGEITYYFGCTES